jgi:Na+-driven multidrug efflux pump
MAQYGREKVVMLALLFFLSAFLACSFLVLVIYFTQEMVDIIHQGPKPQELLWAGIAIAIFVLFALASLLFTIFSCFHIVQGRVKISPAPPTSVHEEQPAAMAELQLP